MRPEIIGIYLTIKVLLMVENSNEAVIAPPWANPKKNPCATQPNGWQLLYWPPDGKCYKIFQTGYPCPDGMELTPTHNRINQQLSAECKCPPKTAQAASDEKCYQLHTLGPCERGYYFALDEQYRKMNNSSKREWGICKQITKCVEKKSVFWAKDEKCYQNLTQGPCPKGQLLVNNNENGLSECKCDPSMKNYQHSNGLCYQHFTKGPCLEKGHLFLPDKSCGCYTFMPHFYSKHEKCYELGTVEPCDSGETYQLDKLTHQGNCECKKGYIRHKNSTSCYRPFTQAACRPNYMLLNSTTCIRQPCERGHLYFPAEDQCYRIGSQGPCPKSRVVSFDFDVRPSLDGASFNGRCICRSAGCRQEDEVICDKNNGLVRYKNECHKLYTQGPCARGSWLVPKRRTKELRLGSSDLDYNETAVCECLPNHSRRVRKIHDKSVTFCISPTVVLADYLNRNLSLSITQFVISK